MPDRDRDQSVDHVLRRVLSDSNVVSPPARCPDGETLAAWTEGSLAAEEAGNVERHLAECARCQAMLAVFVRTTPATPPPQSIWHRWQIRWLVPVATAATAAALWVATPENPAVPSPPDGAASSVAVDAGRPPEAPAELSAPAVPESPASQPSRLQERVDVRARNEAAKQVAQEAVRDQVEERFAPAPPAAAAESDAGRRELGAGAPARTLAVRAAAPSVEIAAPGGAVRWRIVGGRQVERLTAANDEWAPVNIDSPGGLTAGVAVSPSVCWIVGRQGAVYLTTDGAGFERLSFPEAADLMTVTAVDDRTATVSTADGRSWRTSDRGRTWSAVQ